MTDYHPELNPNGFDGISLDAKREEVDVGVAGSNTATNGGAKMVEIDEAELHSLRDKANLWDSMTDSECFISFYTGYYGQGGALRQTLRVGGEHFDGKVERKANKMARELGACSWWVFKPIGMPTNVYYGEHGEEARLERLELDNE